MTNRKIRKWRLRKEYALRQHALRQGAAAAEENRNTSATAGNSTGLACQVNERPKRISKANSRYVGDEWTK